jgi:hypothetical protein
MDREAQSSPNKLFPTNGSSGLSGQVDAVADLLALGFLRYQNRRSKALDDVTRGGTVSSRPKGFDGGNNDGQ